MKSSPGPICATDSTDTYARERWRHVQYLADLFWHRWIREYLPLLQEKQKWVTRRRELKVGDIVLVLVEQTPRGTWPLGRVLEVIRSKDGQVRQARVKMQSGEYTRPISKMQAVESQMPFLQSGMSGKKGGA